MSTTQDAQHPTAGSVGLAHHTPKAPTQEAKEASAKMEAAASFERKTILRRFIAKAQTQGVTDLHISEDFREPVRCRISKRLTIAKNWDGITDADGRLSGGFKAIGFEDLYSELFESDAGHVRPTSSTYDADPHQVRLQLLGMAPRRKIMVRIQLLEPPDLGELLGHAPEIYKSILNARGLVVIAGGMGHGKTTLASSIAKAWADNPESPGHILTVEDPIEYYLKPRRGSVTQVETDLMGFAGDLRENLKDREPAIRRGDINGLFIGEVVHNGILETCLNFGQANEPTVTTVHAGSIANALFSLLNTASKSYGIELARLYVLQNIHAIIHVALAFNEEGRPVPVIQYFQLGKSVDAALIQGLSSPTPLVVLNMINKSLNDEHNPLMLGPQAAYNAAIARDATLESLKLAMPGFTTKTR